MPERFYALSFFCDGRPVRHAPVATEGLDLTKVEETKELLTRHLLALADRNGDRRNAHKYYLEVRELDAKGQPAWGDPYLRFVLPTEPREGWRWP